MRRLQHGKPEGLWTAWHDNGQRTREVTYKNGKRDGLFRTWLANGRKEIESTYKNGELVK